MTTHSSHSSYKAGITVLLGESGEVQQPVQDVAFVMSRLTDSLGQSEIGQSTSAVISGRTNTATSVSQYKTKTNKKQREYNSGEGRNKLTKKKSTTVDSTSVYERTLHE